MNLMHNTAHEHLVSWGRTAFDKGVSLASIENQLLKRGLDKNAALKALNDITSFDHKIHYQSETITKTIVFFMCIMMFVLAVMIFLNLAGVI